MYTLVYLNGNLNHPDTLPSFLQANVGKSLLIQIDCVTPFQGTADDLAEKVYEHLNIVDPQIKVSVDVIQNVSRDSINQQVHFIVFQIRIIN